MSRPTRKYHFRNLLLASILTCLAGVSIAAPPPVAESLAPRSSTAKSDWPMFRGINGQGTLDEADFPAEFGPDLNVLWKALVPPAHSSPILVDDRIFLTAADGEALVTIALDRSTGKELWRKQAPRPRQQTIDTRNGPAAASPVSNGEIVVSFFGDFGLVAYSKSGAPLWQVPLGPFDNIYGMGASPVLFEDRIVLPIDQQSNSKIVAISLKTGEQLWSTPRPEAKSGHTTPIFFHPDGGQPQVILAGSFLLTSYSVETGEKLWWVGGLPFEMKSTPSIDNGLLFIHGYGSPLNEADQQVTLPTWEEVSKEDTNGDGLLSADELTVAIAKSWLSAMDLDGDGKLGQEDWQYLEAAVASKNSMIAVRLPVALARGDITKTNVAWKHFRRVPQLPSPLAHRGTLWMVNDRAITTVFTPKTGEVLTQGRIDGLIDSIYASPVAGGDKVLITGRSGKIAVLSAKAALAGKLETMAVNDLDEVIFATPAMDESTLLVRTQTTLYAFRTPNEQPLQ